MISNPQGWSHFRDQSVVVTTFGAITSILNIQNDPFPSTSQRNSFSIQFLKTFVFCPIVKYVCPTFTLVSANSNIPFRFTPRKSRLVNSPKKEVRFGRIRETASFPRNYRKPFFLAPILQNNFSRILRPVVLFGAILENDPFVSHSQQQSNSVKFLTTVLIKFSKRICSI